MDKPKSGSSGALDGSVVIPRLPDSQFDSGTRSPTISQSIGQSEKAITPAMMPAKPNCEFEDDDLCPVCGGEGFIMAWEGDGSDWGEDTYSGPMDELIECRHCDGTGIRR